MSFVEQEDIFNETNLYCVRLLVKNSEFTVSKPPFRGLKFKESMERFGTDKPDLRNPLEICDITECFKGSGFKIFESNIEKGQLVLAIKAPSSSKKPRAWFDKLNQWARDEGQKV